MLYERLSQVFGILYAQAAARVLHALEDEQRSSIYFATIVVVNLDSQVFFCHRNVHNFDRHMDLLQKCDHLIPQISVGHRFLSPTRLSCTNTGGEDEDSSSFSGSENDSDNVPISTLFD